MFKFDWYCVHICMSACVRARHWIRFVSRIEGKIRFGEENSWTQMLLISYRSKPIKANEIILFQINKHSWMINTLRLYPVYIIHMLLKLNDLIELQRHDVNQSELRIDYESRVFVFVTNAPCLLGGILHIYICTYAFVSLCIFNKE